MAFIMATATYLHNTYGVNNIAMETGESTAYLMNQYIQNNDSAIFFFDLSPITINALECWRTINKTLSKESQLTVHGVDFERMWFVKAMQLVFKKHSAASNTKLYRYISSIPDSACMMNLLRKDLKKIRIGTYSKARTIFRNEKKELATLLGEDYNVAARIMENPVTEKRFGHRDQTIPSKIVRQMEGKKFVCFLGNDHLEPERYFSSLRKYLRNTGNEVTLIVEVGKNCVMFPPRTPQQYVTLGPTYARSNEAMLTTALGEYNKPDAYVLLDQLTFKDNLGKLLHNMPTYYVFSDMLHD